MQEVGNADCVVCHRADYDATVDPPHPGLFGLTCSDCHGTDAWVPAIPINHPWFELRQRHTEIRCIQCHTVGFRPGDTPNTCIGCHQADYDGATMPSHNGYPTDCSGCHDEAAWRPSTFVHSWRLDGAHLTTPCQSCHTGTPPVYAGTPTQCVGCHRADYDSSPYPGHSSFPTTCSDCHSTTAWVPALEGAHPDDRFRISSGAHSGIACADCHDPALGSSAGGMNTTCVGCHNRAREDRRHDGERNYPVGAAPPNFCLMCHANGRS